MSKLEEITAIFHRERIRFDEESVVIECETCEPCEKADDSLTVFDSFFTVKLKAAAEDLVPRLSYRFYGKWTTYQNRRTNKTEKQFDAKTFVRAAPHGRAGVVAYLLQAGKGRGLGPARAAAIWDKFGSDAIRIFRETPEVVAAAVPALAEDQIQAIAEFLRDEQDLEACSIEMIELLTGRGLPRDTARKAIKEWGNRAAETIKRDPYKLMGFRGCGFRRCDALYLHLGLPATRLQRQALCAWYSIASDTDGHTWYPVAVATQGIRKQVGGTDLQPERAIEMATRLGRMSLDNNGALSMRLSEGRQWVAEGRKAWCEDRLAQAIVDSQQEVTQWPNADDVQGIDEHQREQLRLAIGGGLIGILGGGPGTGKTHTAGKLIKLLIDSFGSDQIAVGAPTGKAAVRITEAMQASGINLRARTWHSLLGIGAADKRSGNWGFKHNEGDPLPFRVLVGDESSMGDTNLLSSIFRARAVGCHVLLIGDVNQLPPVGHGAPLRDLIAAGLPYGELKEIKRNSGGIVEACAAMRDERSWRAAENLQVYEWGNPDLQLKQVVQCLAEAKAAGLDPVWDCQIVVAVNDKSPLSRKEVNKLLQGELNSNPAVPGQIFRVGDKIVNTKNGYYPAVEVSDSDSDADEIQTNEKGEVYVANGEQARVIAVAEKMVIAELSSPRRTVKIPKGRTEDGDADSQADGGGDGANSDKPSTSTGCAWDLAYGISVHKSQGSEWPVVIVLIDEYPGARMVCDRSWLYTAVSRARQRCILIGRKATADRFCRTQKMERRKTFLRELIAEKSAERVLVEL